MDQPDHAAARPLFGVFKSEADRIIDHLGPALALQQHKLFRKDTVLIVDGTRVPTRDDTVAEQSRHLMSLVDQVGAGAATFRIAAKARSGSNSSRRCKQW